MLILQCKRNGWTNLSGELEQYEKELQNEKDAESESFLHYNQHLSILMKESVSIMPYCFFQHQGEKKLSFKAGYYHLTVFIFIFRDASSKSPFKDQE